MPCAGPCGFAADGFTASIDRFITAHKPVAEDCYLPSPLSNWAGAFSPLVGGILMAVCPHTWEPKARGILFPDAS